MITNSRIHLSILLEKEAEAYGFQRSDRRSKIEVRLNSQPNEVRLLVIAIASNIIKQHRRQN
jgi:hypothetical protein